jgi:hypothetical protein
MRKKTVFIFGPLLFVVALTYSGVAQQTPNKLAIQSSQWRCDAEQKWTCELPDGCERQDASTVWVVLDFARSTYQRCDRAGCDIYSMRVSEQGLFTYIQLPEHPDMFMKIGLANLFVEVAAQGVSALNSLGTCKAQR